MIALFIRTNFTLKFLKHFYSELGSSEQSLPPPPPPPPNWPSEQSPPPPEFQSGFSPQVKNLPPNDIWGGGGGEIVHLIPELNSWAESVFRVLRHAFIP